MDKGSNYPFDPTIHLKCASPDEAQKEQLKLFRQTLSKNSLYSKYREFCSDSQLLRFLTAKNFDLKKSLNLINDALAWRESHLIEEIESKDGWEVKFSKEGETGKVYNPGFDCWGRPIVIFDNGVQNTTNVDDQIIFVAWSLELAVRMMPPHVDKYLVFMNLSSFR